jgi:hypothetical protein
MGRKVQLAALILGMLLVAAERFTANAAGSRVESMSPQWSDFGFPIRK